MFKSKAGFNSKKIALMIAGIYCIIRGIAYLPKLNSGHLPKGLELISEYIPIEVWGGVWLSIGAFAILTVVLRRETKMAWSFIVGIMAAWGSAYLCGAGYEIFHHGTTRSWLTASSYLLPATVFALLSRGESLDNFSIKERRFFLDENNRGEIHD